MQFKKGSVLYARIDHKIEGKELTDSIYREYLAYVKSVACERFLLGGGFSNAVGGMILFEAADLDEAQKIVQSDPIIERGFYRCDLFVWQLAEVSPDRGE